MTTKNEVDYNSVDEMKKTTRILVYLALFVGALLGAGLMFGAMLIF